MSIKKVDQRGALVALVCFALAGCGGSSNPGSPSGGASGSGGSGGGGGSSSGSCTSVGPLGSAKGTITATINGSTFNGGVPTGQAIYTPIAPAAGLPAQDFINIQGTCGDLTSLLITARATVGTTTIGVDASGSPLRNPQTQQPLIHSGTLQLRANGVAAGTWITSLLGGTGTITITSVSTVSAAGSFSLTMVPQAGSGASGNRTVTGQFNVTF